MVINSEIHTESDRDTLLSLSEGGHPVWLFSTFADRLHILAIASPQSLRHGEARDRCLPNSMNTWDTNL